MAITLTEVGRTSGWQNGGATIVLTQDIPEGAILLWLSMVWNAPVSVGSFSDTSFVDGPLATLYDASAKSAGTTLFHPRIRNAGGAPPWASGYYHAAVAYLVEGPVYSGDADLASASRADESNADPDDATLPDAATTLNVTGETWVVGGFAVREGSTPGTPGFAFDAGATDEGAITDSTRALGFFPFIHHVDEGATETFGATGTVTPAVPYWRYFAFTLGFAFETQDVIVRGAAGTLFACQSGGNIRVRRYNSDYPEDIASDFEVNTTVVTAQAQSGSLSVNDAQILDLLYCYGVGPFVQHRQSRDWGVSFGAATNLFSDSRDYSRVHHVWDRKGRRLVAMLYKRAAGAWWVSSGSLASTGAAYDWSDPVEALVDAADDWGSLRLDRHGRPTFVYRDTSGAMQLATCRNLEEGDWSLSEIAGSGYMRGTHVHDEKLNRVVVLMFDRNTITGPPNAYAWWTTIGTLQDDHESYAWSTPVAARSVGSTGYPYVHLPAYLAVRGDNRYELLWDPSRTESRKATCKLLREDGSGSWVT